MDGPVSDEVAGTIGFASPIVVGAVLLVFADGPVLTWLGQLGVLGGALMLFAWLVFLLIERLR